VKADFRLARRTTSVGDIEIQAGTPGQPDAPWFERTTLSIDWYRAKITNAIVAAIDKAWSEAGVAILVDLGGAETNSEMAVEMMPEERRARVVICNAPIVEGAVMAATEASGGSPLAVVQATAEELMAHVAGKVAPYKKVRRVEFIDAIPKSPSGKILRRLLRDRPVG